MKTKRALRIPRVKNHGIRLVIVLTLLLGSISPQPLTLLMAAAAFEQESIATIQNNRVKVAYNLNAGTFDLIDLPSGRMAI